MSNWNASNYRQRKAGRLSKVKPQWVTNPETGEQFYLRPVRSVMSSVLAVSLPSALTNEAIKAWREKGMAGTTSEEIAADLMANMSQEDMQESARETQRLSVIIQEACVIPLLSNDPHHKIVFTDDWKAQAIEGLKEIDPEFNAETFNPADIVLDPRDLDEQDSRWLFKWAAGIVLDVPMKGGGAASISDLTRFRKKLNRGSRARANGSKVRKAS